MPDRLPPRAAARAALALRQALLRAADAVVPPELALFQHSMAFVRSELLIVVAELGIADALDRGPRTAAELAAALGLDADSLHRVLRGLAAHGVVRLDRRGRFRLTRVGRGLRAGHAPSVRPWARYLGFAETRAAWAGLADAVRT